jgi:hypothetical protein
MHGDAYPFWLIVSAIALLIAILVARSNSKWASQEKSQRLKAEDQIRLLGYQMSGIRSAHEDRLNAVQAQYNKVLDHMRAMDKIFAERKVQFPWLVSALADLNQLEAKRDAKFLAEKKHAAVKAADVVRSMVACVGMLSDNSAPYATG